MLAESVEDPDAFAAFYAMNARRVARFLARQTRDAELALDLTAETFAIALERRHQFRGSTAAEEEGWLFAIARRELARYWRHGKVERSGLARLEIELPTFTDGQLEEVERLAELAELRVLLDSAVGRLPAEQSHAVRERIVGERTYAEIAAEAGVSEQVVRARVSRGLRALAALIEERRPEGVA